MAGKGSAKSAMMSAWPRSFRRISVDQSFRDFVNVGAKLFDAAGRKCLAARLRSRVCDGRVHKQELLHHHPRDRVQIVAAHAAQLFGRADAIGGESMQNGDDILIAGDDPGMQERIPVHWVLFAKPAEKRVRIGEHRRVQKLVQTQVGSIVF